MSISSTFSTLLQTSFAFTFLAIALTVFIRTPIRHRLTASSILLLWLIVLLPLVLPVKIQLPSPNTTTNPLVRTFVVTLERLNPSQLIDWGEFQELFNPGQTLAISTNEAEADTHEVSQPSHTTFIQQIFSLLFWIWLTGAALIAAFYSYQQLALRKLLKSSCILKDPTILEIHQQLIQHLDIHNKHIPLYSVNGIGTAAVVGLWKPKVLLSPAILKCDEAQLHSVLLHELTHYQKAHLWFNSFGLLCTLLHWFNPVVWIAYRELRRSIELACDEAAISRQPASKTPATYAHHLLDLMSQFSSLPSHRLSFLGLFNNIETRFIQQRIVMIKNINKSKLPLSLVLFAGISCTAVAITQLTPGEDAPPPPPPPPPVTMVPPPPPPPADGLTEIHIDEINLNFDGFSEEPEFSEAAKKKIKEELLPILQSENPMDAYEALSQFSNDAQVQFLKGNLCLQDNRVAQAERHYINALKIHPGYERALKNLLMIYVTSGHAGEAYPLLQKYLSVAENPTAQFYLMAGFAAMNVERYEEAVPFFQKAMELDPDDNNAPVDLFQSYMFLEDYKNAEGILQQLIQHSNDPVTLAKYHKYYANVAVALENPGLAAEQLNRSLELNPEDPEAEAGRKMLKEIYEKNPELK